MENSVSSRFSHLMTVDPNAVQPWIAERDRTYADREAYRLHKVNAKRRGIPFRFTFEEWVAWWQSTGHYHERGSQRGQYVMARTGDQGAYELGNVECMQAQDNSAAPHIGAKRTAQTRKRMSDGIARHHKLKRLRKRLNQEG